MPVKFGLWRVDGSSVEQVLASGISSEERLEDILELQIEILGLGKLFQIGRQVITVFGKRIDLLAIDEQGGLYVIELKKDRTPRDVVAQTLEYGFWVQSLSFAAIRELYAKHHG
jgi:RecB family endonuclease NucS